MAWLTSRDELPRRPARVLVAGTAGSGKSTLARAVGSVFGLPYVELDALFHGPNWTPRDEFLDDVRRLVAADQGVTEWQYPAARPLLVERADLLVLLDIPRRQVMTRIIRRTLSRRLRRTELWNGNVEAPLRTFFTDSEHVIRWAWHTHAEHLPRVIEVTQDIPELPVVRLRTAREADRWLTGPLTRSQTVT